MILIGFYNRWLEKKEGHGRGSEKMERTLHIYYNARRPQDELDITAFLLHQRTYPLLRDQIPVTIARLECNLSKSHTSNPIILKCCPEPRPVSKKEDFSPPGFLSSPRCKWYNLGVVIWMNDEYSSWAKASKYLQARLHSRPIDRQRATTFRDTFSMMNHPLES